MPTYYVGPGGNDANNGTTWALRRLTLNSAEDLLAAGDTLMVGPGVYREMLTVDVSGAAGQPITYIGDYTGAATDGTGGVVRITGSDNDQTATRASCITSNLKDYRTFTGFLLDTVTIAAIYSVAISTGWTIDKCLFLPGAGIGFTGIGAGTANTIQNCCFSGNGTAIGFSNGSVVDNSGHVVQNCLFMGGVGRGISITRVGGITVRNCVFRAQYFTMRVETALTVGQTTTVNNCVIENSNYGFYATAVGEITEDYNTLFGVTTARTNTNIGANSVTYPPLWDARWFFEAVNGGRLITPFDLASYSQLVNLAGTAPTTTDMRGTAAIGGVREWGALEYDSTLLIEGGSGGAVSISPLRGW